MAQAGVRDLFNASALVAFAVASGLAVWASFYKKPQRRNPPGPPQRFLIGNLKDIPSGGSEWDGFEKLSQQCDSGVVYLSVFGTNLLIINSFDAARELLEKRGSIYSDRPRLLMLKELMSFDWNLVLMSYGKAFTAHRRVVRQEFMPKNVVQYYHPIIKREVVALLSRLLTAPDDLIKHIKHMTGATIMMIAYGHEVKSAKDPYVGIAEAVHDLLDQRPQPELVDVFPILRYLPSWFPGAGFQRAAKTGRDLAVHMRTVPFEAVKEGMASGTAIPSMVTRLLQQDISFAEDVEVEDLIKNTSAAVYGAGADTTAGALINFSLAMTLYPDVQARAQRELDQVVGRERLPSFEDRDRLPYIAKIVKESLRWRPVTPLGIPHATVQDDEYLDGYIPKGTTVVANLYAMLHDESTYANADAFNPDRYDPTPEKPNGEPDPTRAAFGFGRRRCPGRFFVTDSLWYNIASILHTFAISNPEGCKGGSTEGIKWSSGIVSFPSPFPFKFKPRFPGATELVNTYMDGGLDTADRGAH